MCAINNDHLNKTFYFCICTTKHWLRDTRYMYRVVDLNSEEISKEIFYLLIITQHTHTQKTKTNGKTEFLSLFSLRVCVFFFLENLNLWMNNWLRH